MEKDVTEIFRDRLKGTREEKGLTQADLAEKTGLPPSSISHFENGPRKPSFDNLRRLAAALSVTTDYLLGRTDEADSQGKANILFRKAASLDKDELSIIESMIDVLTKQKTKN